MAPPGGQPGRAEKDNFLALGARVGEPLYFESTEAPSPQRSAEVHRGPQRPRGGPQRGPRRSTEAQRRSTEVHRGPQRSGDVKCDVRVSHAGPVESLIPSSLRKSCILGSFSLQSGIKIALTAPGAFSSSARGLKARRHALTPAPPMLASASKIRSIS